MPPTIGLLLLVGGCSCGAPATTPDAARPEADVEAMPEDGERSPTSAAEQPPQLLVSLQLFGPSPLGRRTLAVHHQIPEGWHIYWRNPGESGLATRIEASLPEGLQAGATLYPAPEVIASPGDIVTYGYSGTAILFVPLPAELPDEGRLSVHSKWLLCREACTKGEALVSLDYDASDAANEPDRPTRLALARVPRPASELDGLIELRWDGTDLHAAAKPGNGILTSFFPYETDPVRLVAHRIDAGELSLHYALPARGDSPGGQGVVALVEGQASPAYFELAAPWPASVAP